MSKKKSKINQILPKKDPWAQYDNPIWLVTSLKFLRNIDNFMFPGKLSTDHRRQIMQLLEKELLVLKELQKPDLFPAEELEPQEKEMLAERFFITESVHQAHSGEGFVIDQTAEFLAVCNVQNHLQLQLMDYQGKLEKSLDRLVDLDGQLGKNIKFSYSEQFGFLTSDPTRCGTAFLLSAYLQLPALIHSDSLNDLLEPYKDDSITFTGVQGDPDKLPGDILIASNTRTVGANEEQILSTVHACATKLMVEEQSKRSAIKKSGDEHFKDLVSRAYGFLEHGYQMQTLEAMNRLSLLKLGEDVGWIKGISQLELNQLLFNCRRSHLSRLLKIETDADDLPQQRAKYLHEALKDVKLTI